VVVSRAAEESTMGKSWRDDLVTGVHIIDAQHKELFARTDKLLSRCLEGADLEVYRQAFEYLRGYVNHHFSTEEGLMDEASYPQAEFHKGLHRWFEKELDGIHAEITAPGQLSSSALRFSYLLIDWFRNHILGVDHKLTAYLKAQSATPPATPAQG
jgi:hemerythrin